jgi:VanZ family protein
MGLRNAHIGIGVMIAILIVGFIFSNHSDKTAQQAIAMVALISAFAVYHVLDERERRRERDR